MVLYGKVIQYWFFRSNIIQICPLLDTGLSYIIKYSGFKKLKVASFNALLIMCFLLISQCAHIVMICINDSMSVIYEFNEFLFRH